MNVYSTFLKVKVKIKVKHCYFTVKLEACILAVDLLV